MARTKKNPKVLDSGKRIFKVLQTKRRVSKSDSSQSQGNPVRSQVSADPDATIDLTQSNTNSDESDQQLHTARKSTSAFCKVIRCGRSTRVVESSEDNTESEDDTPRTSVVKDQRYVNFKARDGTIKKRYAPGCRALKEIRFMQQTTNSAIPKAPFARVVREITRGISSKEFKFSVGSLMALHVSGS
jgi:hypothetical protein